MKFKIGDRVRLVHYDGDITDTKPFYIDAFKNGTVIQIYCVSPDGKYQYKVDTAGLPPEHEPMHSVGEHEIVGEHEKYKKPKQLRSWSLT